MVGTRKMLEIHGLGQFWQYPGLVGRMSKEEWKRRVAEAVEEREDREREKRFKEMSSKASRRYVRLKWWGEWPDEAAVFTGESGRRGARVHERYLDDHCEGAGRKLKMLCRAGCLPVLDRVGLEMEWPAALRMCALCGTEAETVQHFVVACPAHQKHRDAMVRGVRRGVEGAQVLVESMAPSDQCDLFLGKSTGVAKLDDWIDTLFKRFARKAWAGRSKSANAVQEVTGVEGALWGLGRWARVAG
jgi:hypothetical protein